MFTIGQRKGLPGGSASPRYVVDIDPATATVIVGGAEDLVCDEFTIANTIWHCVDAAPFEATVKIRYAAPAVEATIYPGENGEARVKLREPQRAITPGQAAVCYRQDEVLGGGWIERQKVVPILRPSMPAPKADESFEVEQVGCGAKR
jgi:tRNA-specific 2-thiouridylase